MSTFVLIVGAIVYVGLGIIVSRHLSPWGESKRWTSGGLLLGRKHFTPYGWKLMNLIRLFAIVWVALFIYLLNKR